MHTISKAHFRTMPEAILPQGSSIVLLVIKASSAVVAIAASEELTVGLARLCRYYRVNVLPTSGRDSTAAAAVRC